MKKRVAILLGVLALSATPASAYTAVYSCGGTAPQVTSCTRAVTIPSTYWFVSQNDGPAMPDNPVVHYYSAFQGTVVLELTSATGSIYWCHTGFAYYNTPVVDECATHNYTQTGTFVPGQAATLRGYTSPYSVGTWTVALVVN